MAPWATGEIGKPKDGGVLGLPTKTQGTDPSRLGYQSLWALCPLWVAGLTSSPDAFFLESQAAAPCPRARALPAVTALPQATGALVRSPPFRRAEAPGQEMRPWGVGRGGAGATPSVGPPVLTPHL